MANNLSGQVDLVSATEGTPLPTTTDVASFTDGTTSDTAANFTATIDWGDGTTTIGTVVGANGSFTVQGGNTYADDNFYQPVVTITRTTDNAQLVLFGGVNVDDADNLTGQGQPTIVANPNQALTNVVVATFTNNPAFTNVPADFTVNIDWGDGTTTAGTLALNGSTYTVTGSHTYASAGNFTISTFMNDDSPDGDVGFASTQAAVGFGGTDELNSATETFAVPAGTTVATFVDNANLPSTDYTATIDWGDGVTTTGAVSGSSGSFTVTSVTDHTYADEGNFPGVVTITRTTDNTTVVLSGTVVVAEADNLSAAGAATVKGDPGVALNNVTVATFSDSDTQNIAGDFVATIDWGDGTTSIGTIAGSNGSFTVNGSHTYTQNGQDNITVSVAEDPSDGQGFATAIASTTALIGLAPGQGSTISAIEGTPIPGGTQVATFTDSNASDTAASFTASIDWGDGVTTAGTVSGSNGAFTVTGGPHTYADERGLDNAVTTTVTRTSDNATATITGQATVGEADVLAVTGDNISGFAGQPLNNVQVATFTDTYTGNAASDFTAFIDWGDGTTTTGTVSGASGMFTVNGSHTYAAGGTDQVKVTVLDDGVGTATASGTATATIAVRTLAGQMALNAATEGTALPNSTAVATFTDNVTSDAAGDFTATIVWGDGTTTSGTVVGSNGSFTVEGGHTYADEAGEPVSVTLTHTADQAQATASGNVAVAEGDVLTAHSTPIFAAVNRAFSGAVATFTDADTATAAGDFTATINWGDGTTTTGTVVGSNGAFTVDGTHTYATTGFFTVQVQGGDDSPGTATYAATSTADVGFAGTVVLTAATEGKELNKNTPVATFTDNTPGDTAKSFTATINWGDGTTTAGSIEGKNGTFTVEGSHRYADEGNDTATVTLTRTSDQLKSTASGTVAVAENDVLTPQGIVGVAAPTFSGTVATFSDSDSFNVAGDFAATIDWGDGTTTNGTVSGANGTLTVNGSHTYTQTALETVKVKLTDDAPGTATATATSLILAVDPPLFGGHASAGSTPMVWQSSGDVSPGDWMNNLAAAHSQAGSGDSFTASGQSDLLFENTNGSTVHSGEPTQSGPTALDGSVSTGHMFGGVGIDSGGSLGRLTLADSSSPQHATLASG
jgi:hypothetical protein